MSTAPGALKFRGRALPASTGALRVRSAGGRRDRVQRLFDALWDNDDVPLYRAGVDVLDGRHEWLEKGILGLGTPEAPRGREAAEAEPKKVAVGVS